MKNNKVLIVWIIILVIILIFSLVLIYFLLSGEKISTTSLAESLAAADKDIASGYLPGAETRLKHALKLARSKKDYLRILKRIWQVDKYREDHLFLETGARTAWQAFPSDQSLAYLAAYGALKNEKVAAAQAILDKAGHSELLNRLWLEVYLRRSNNKETPPELKLGYRLSRAVRLLDSDDPAVYLGIADLLSEKSLYLDAALLYMARGRPSEAWEIAKEHLGAPEFDPATLLIAFDNLDLEAAALKLQRLLENDPDEPDYLALAGDIYFRQGQYARAKYNYLKTLNHDIRNSPGLYLNLSWIYQYEGKMDSAELYLDQGLDLYPGNADLLFEKAKFLQQQGRLSEAAVLIDAFPGQLTGPLSLLKLSISRRSMDPERFYLGLWEVFNENRDHPLVSRTLIALLLEAEHTRDAQTALEIYRAHSGVDRNWWLLHYSGLLAAAGGNFREALLLLDESLKLNRDRYVMYNRGIVLLAAGEFSEAVTNFWQIVKLDEESLTRDRQFNSLVVMKIGEALAGQGDNRAAIKQFQDAFEINPENYHALLLWKQLERIEEK